MHPNRRYCDSRGIDAALERRRPYRERRAPIFTDLTIHSLYRRSGIQRRQLIRRNSDRP